MARLLMMAILFSAVMGQFQDATANDDRVYEMRVYYAAEGKLDALNSRFRDHTVKLFEKHGITNVGYWEPIENPEAKLIYILSYPSPEAREASWKEFAADPAWQEAKKASEVDGKLVAKVEQTFLTATDYSTEIKPAKKGERVFELRTYTATEGNLGHLNSRFRDATCKLFEKHGITNIGYWTPMEDQAGAGKLLIYIISHKSQEAAKASYGAFGQDPEWKSALKASEEKAGGSLTAPMGIKSVFMKATDYSPIQ